MKNILLVIVSNIFMMQIMAQEMEQPCGPSSVLSEKLSRNVASDSRCFELRFYTAEAPINGKGGVDDLHQRFREKQVTLLEKHGAELIAFWQRLDNPNTVVWLLAFDDRNHRDAVFTSFRADPEWLALRDKYNVPVNRELFFMSASDYSALK